MLDYLKNKSIGNFINLGAAIFALVMLIVYSALTSTYGILSAVVVVCLVFVIILNAVLFAFETNFNEYLKVIASILTAFAAILFFVDCVGDISDYINKVNMLGVGIPFGSIITMTVFMFLLVIVNVVSCVFGKKE